MNQIVFDGLLVAYWNEGTPEGISLYAELNGVDPIYRFPRTCDISPYVGMFQLTQEDGVLMVK